MESSPATAAFVEHLDAAWLEAAGIDPEHDLAWSPDDDDVRTVADARRRALARRRHARIGRDLREARVLSRFWRSVAA